MNGKELLRKVHNNGWQRARIHGSHHILVKGTKTLSVPVHGAKDLPTGTLNKILTEGGLK